MHSPDQGQASQIQMHTIAQIEKSTTLWQHQSMSGSLNGISWGPLISGSCPYRSSSNLSSGATWLIPPHQWSLQVNLYQTCLHSWATHLSFWLCVLLPSYQFSFSIDQFLSYCRLYQLSILWSILSRSWIDLWNLGYVLVRLNLQDHLWIQHKLATYQ